MTQRIRFTGYRQVDIHQFDLRPLEDDEVRVRAIYSLMSTGTEGIVYGRLFEEGTHWAGLAKYPFHPGYAMVGEIIEIGSAVTTRRVGQRVAVRSSHASSLNAKAESTSPVPDEVDSQRATWFALAKIASHSALAGDFGIGDSLAVVGAGPVGQMAIRWAAASGVTSLTVVDPVSWRCELAQAGGATAVVNKPVDEAKEALWQHSPDGEGPDVVIEATGHPQVFAPTLALPRRFGRVVLLGDAGAPNEQRLTGDIVLRGINVVGVHDGHNDGRWNNASATASFFKLIAAGRFPLDGLISHTFKPADAQEAYELAATRRSETMGILFDWT